MIHKIEEERKKVNRYHVSCPPSLTDEELARLIQNVEEREMLSAPGHLKESVFFQIDAERMRRKRQALFSYRAKVLIGMAAALAVLFLVPVDGTEKTDMPYTGILETLRGEETQGGDEWEQELIDRQRDIEETWEKYRRGQERMDARRQYFRKFAEKIKDYKEWED